MHDGKNIREWDMVPVEQIAAEGKTAIEGVVQKQLFYDGANICHQNTSLLVSKCSKIHSLKTQYSPKGDH